ncbi:toprim domain-containing protein [Actinomadura harenae]|uniref:Toprim domain-containing protein n=1 Tax=Actinomadura harenae TaxID=2483351 RepID=A0A3M2M3C3_9ACTN|nr:toprim domain-containing protein [Actinomadura harenae]RMI43912.1 toprim domain-containing protein [Actinomadura harenae]
MTSADLTPPGPDADTTPSAGVRQADEQRQQQLAALRGIADHQTRQLLDGRLAWTAWLNLADRHGRFGFTNTLLIGAQHAAATEIRTYNDWQAHSRQVRKGEHGIRLISRQDVPYSGFDITQTDGPALDSTPPTQPAPTSDALERLLRVAADLGVYVDRGTWPYLGRPNRRIVLPGELDDELALTVMAHQLSHVLQSGEHPDPDPQTPCRGVRRVRADSIAYLTLTHLGADPGEIRFPLISSWAGTDPRAPALNAASNTATQIVRASQQIRRRLESSPPTPPAPSATPTATARAAPEPQPKDLVKALAQAHDYFRARLPDSWVPKYLTERGIPPAALDTWTIGYAPTQGMLEHLKTLGFTDSTLQDAGLTRDTGNRRRPLFSDRLVLPLRTPDGTVVGFIGRRPDTGRGPKYLNTPTTSLFNKSQTLFGLHEHRDRLSTGARPLLVEGPLDVIAVATAAPDGLAPLAPCGTTLTTEHLAILHRHADLDTVGLVLALDGDAPGQRAMLRTWKTLLQVNGPIDAVILPKDQDPADILRYQGSVNVHEALRSVVPLADLVVDAQIDRFGGTLDHAEHQVAAARAAAGLIAQMPQSEITRQVPRVATATGVPSNIVTTLVADAISPDIPAPPAPEHSPLPGRTSPTSTHRPSRRPSR